MRPSATPRWRPSWALALLAFLAAPLASAQPALDLVGRALLRTARAEAPAGARVGLHAVRAAAPHDVRVVVGADGQPVVNVLVRLSDRSAVAAVEAAGLELRTLAGDVAVGQAPVAALGRIAGASGVRSVSVSRVRPGLRRDDPARADTRVNDVYAGTGLPQPYTGAGVVVGVIDSGIDVDHPAFRMADGTPRVVRLLELLPDGGMQEWTGEDLRADLAAVTQVDPGGHGTHVAGIAAGSDVPGNEAYRGVAPEAEIIAVKADRCGSESDGCGFDDTDVIEAISYVFDYAASRGLPAVVNLSLGGLGGAQDGTSDYERALDNLTGPGRVIVAAAGNEGTSYLHAGYANTPGVQHEVLAATSLNPVYDADNPDAVEPLPISILADDRAVNVLRANLYTFTIGADGAVSVQLAALGSPVAVDADAPDFEAETYLVAGSDTLAAMAVGAMRSADSGDAQLMVQFIGYPGTDLTAQNGYAFGLILGGSTDGRVDLWVPRDGTDAFFRNPPAGTTTTRIAADNDYSLNNPASALRVVAVGAYNTQNTWTDIDGNVQTQNDETGQPVALGARADFSSMGPTRDGRPGVDVLAPGNIIASALSLDQAEPLRGRALPTGLHTMMEGTSMATPHVTGVIALLLQADGSLDAEETLAILRGTARTDAFTGEAPNPSAGYGKVDAYAAIQAVLVGTAGEGPAAAAGLVLESPYPNPARGGAAVAFSLPAAGPARLAVYDALGREVAVLADGPLAAGPHLAEVPGGRLAAGVYVVRLQAAGTVAARALSVVR